MIIHSNKYGEFKVLIDLEDVEICKKYKWFIQKVYNAEDFFYAKARINGKVELLHRFLMNIKERFIYVDHIDGNPMNCRKYNLRLATPQQNSINRQHENKNTKSKYRGVLWYHYRNVNKWVAHIKLNGKVINLGYFDKLEDAIEARKNAEIKYKNKKEN